MDNLYKIAVPVEPPVLKNSKQMRMNWKTKKMFPVASDKYKTIEKFALDFIYFSPRPKTITVPIHAKFTFTGPWIRGSGNVPDLSNLYCGPEDWLQKARIITDDNQIESHDGSRRIYACDICGNCKGGKRIKRKNMCPGPKKCGQKTITIELFEFIE